MVALASHLMAGVSAGDYRKWGPPDIRAQLVNTRERRLEMEFRYVGDRRSFHALNAVSPAFTCSMPFSEFVLDQIEQKQNITKSSANRSTGRLGGSRRS